MAVPGYQAVPIEANGWIGASPVRADTGVPHDYRLLSHVQPDSVTGWLYRLPPLFFTNSAIGRNIHAHPSYSLTCRRGAGPPGAGTTRPLTWYRTFAPPLQSALAPRESPDVHPPSHLACCLRCDARTPRSLRAGRVVPRDDRVRVVGGLATYVRRSVKECRMRVYKGIDALACVLTASPLPTMLPNGRTNDSITIEMSREKEPGQYNRSVHGVLSRRGVGEGAEPPAVLRPVSRWVSARTVARGG
jgi:hypothetical protein